METRTQTRTDNISQESLSLVFARDVILALAAGSWRLGCVTRSHHHQNSSTFANFQHQHQVHLNFKIKKLVIVGSARPSFESLKVCRLFR